MSTNDDDNYTQRTVLIFLGVLVGVVTAALVVWAAWLGLNGDAAKQEVASAEQTMLASDVAANNAPSVAMSDDDAKVVVDNGVVKFYFAVGKADLAQGAEEALQDIIAGVQAGKKAVVSGYHDSTGGVAVNEEVAKKRALAVKDALLRLGVTEEQIELVKPQVSEGTGAAAEARRVEVVLQ